MDRRSPQQCMTCRQDAGADQVFLHWRDGYLCPTCFMRSARRRQTVVFLRDVALFTVGFCLILPLLSAKVGPIAWPNLLLVAVVIYLAITVHELGHAAAAWLTGGKVFEIRIGSGRNLARWRVGRSVITLGWLPGAGFCAAAFPTHDHIRKRTILLLSAGMIANLFCVLVAAVGLAAHRLQTPMALVEAIFLGSLFALIASFWPGEGVIGGVPQSSDGLELMRLLRGKRCLELYHLAYYALEGVYAIQRREFAAAVNWCRRGLAEYPNSELLKNNLAVALIELECYAEALPILEELVYSDGPGAGAEFRSSLAQQAFHHALLLNNLAAVTVLASVDTRALQKASALASLAVEMFPAQPNFRGTLGAVLVEQGQFEAGIEHLTWAYRRSPEPGGRTYCLAYAAIAYQRQGDHQKAADFLAKVAASEADGYAVRKAQSELTTAQPL